MGFHTGQYDLLMRCDLQMGRDRKRNVLRSHLFMGRDLRDDLSGESTQGMQQDSDWT